MKRLNKKEKEEKEKELEVILQEENGMKELEEKESEKIAAWKN